MPPIDTLTAIATYSGIAVVLLILLTETVTAILTQPVPGPFQATRRRGRVARR